MWREVLATDPDDVEARGALADDIAAGLTYALHEWPSGIVIEPDESMADALDDIDSMLDDLSALDDPGSYAQTLVKWSANATVFDPLRVSPPMSHRAGTPDTSVR